MRMSLAKPFLPCLCSAADRRDKPLHMRPSNRVPSCHLACRNHEPCKTCMTPSRSCQSKIRPDNLTKRGADYPLTDICGRSLKHPCKLVKSSQIALYTVSGRCLGTTILLSLFFQPRECKVSFAIQTYFVNPLPSSLTIIQHCGRIWSSISNFLTYSNLLLAMKGVRESCKPFSPVEARKKGLA